MIPSPWFMAGMALIQCAATQLARRDAVVALPVHPRRRAGERRPRQAEARRREGGGEAWELSRLHVWTLLPRMGWHLVLGLLFCSAITQTAGAIPESKPLPTRSTSTGPLFEAIPPSSSGIHLVHVFPTNAPLVLMQEQGSGCGVCAGDINGDGLPDLFFSNYDRGCRLYRNLGGFRFADVTEQAGVGALGRWCGGVTMVDIDNDGDLDIYVCCLNSPNLLFINRGVGTFEERAAAFGLAWAGASVSAAFADYDRDGRLDMYLLTHRNPYGPDQRLPRDTRDAMSRGILRRDAAGRVEVGPRFRELFEFIDKGGGKAELAIAGQADQLFRQKPDGTFSNVTEQAGIRGNDIGLGVSWWDYDGDGWPDIYVANDHKTPDRLWHNRRDGTFVETTTEVLPHVPHASMGTDIGDVDNDGRLDLLATDMAGSTRSRRMIQDQDTDRKRWFFEQSMPRQVPRNALYLATGAGRVFEAAFQAGVQATDWTWSPKFGDFDNDGWLDLFVANGMSRDFLDGDVLARLRQPGHPGWLQEPVLRQANLAFQNLGALKFERAEQRWGLDHVSASFGAAIADLDGDGDLDLVVMNLGEPVSVYRNRESVHHRLVLRLQGMRGNRWGVGAVVHLEFEAGIQTRTITTTSGFMSANEPIIHAGLGSQSSISKLSVDWPGGAHQVFENLPADRAYRIVEPDATPSGPALPPVEATWLRASDPLAGFAHAPRSSDTFSQDPLLPWTMSHRGPAVAIGDVDGDGRDDVYVGGAGGQAGVLGIHQADGTFRRVSVPAFETDRELEDAAALFFDADGDGDLDLVVVSGGDSVDQGPGALRDRLYLNDGRGGFTRATDALPPGRDAGTVVCAADFDRDGDLDLFIGGGAVPGRYPVPAASRLLRNDRGRFTDVTDTLAPGLKTGGVVTGAVWSDADGDGWLDLVITREWGSVSLYLNRHGRLEDATESSGFGAGSGLWQGIVACDVDGDGDMDYVTTNLGLNTRYHASREDPLKLYRGDLQETGQTNVVIAGSENGIAYPEHGRRALLSAFPPLADAFPTFKGLAGATLTNLFSTRALAGAFQVRVDTLESGVWLNDGHAHFTFRPLPFRAQLAPSLGLEALDLDGDGLPELCLSQNFLGPNPEVGRMDGGMGLILRSLGNGSFEAVDPGRSGYVVAGDGRGVGRLDLGGDGFADLVVAVHGAGLRSFENTTPKVNPGVVPFAVRLRGQAGNPLAVGARVEVRHQDGSRQVAEVRAGGGGVSDSGATLYMAHKRERMPSRIIVRWPTGRETEAPVTTPAGTMMVRE